MSSANGFEFLTDVQIFMNCPSVGSGGGIANVEKESFATSINTSLESVWLLGSLSGRGLIFAPGMPISFVAGNDTEIGTTTTNMMGAYEYELEISKVPDGYSNIKIMHADEILRVIPVTQSGSDDFLNFTSTEVDGSDAEEEIDVEEMEDDDEAKGNDESRDGLSATGLAIIIVASCIGVIALFIILMEGLICVSPGNNNGAKGGPPEQPRQ
jgi:hypothetical protein